MTFEEVKALIQLVNKSELAELKFEDGDQKIVIRTAKYSTGKQQIIHSAAPAAVQSAPSLPFQTPTFTATLPKTEMETGAVPPAPTTEGGNYLEVKSPIVGTFYRSAGSDKPPYVKVGDTVDKGTVVCIIEAMKLFNEIESEVKGKIVKVMVDDASPVEYDQVLFLVDPKG